MDAEKIKSLKAKLQKEKEDAYIRNEKKKKENYLQKRSEKIKISVKDLTCKAEEKSPKIDIKSVISIYPRGNVKLYRKNSTEGTWSIDQETSKNETNLHVSLNGQEIKASTSKAITHVKMNDEKKAYQASSNCNMDAQPVQLEKRTNLSETRRLSTPRVQRFRSKLTEAQKAERREKDAQRKRNERLKKKDRKKPFTPSERKNQREKNCRNVQAYRARQKANKEKTKKLPGVTGVNKEFEQDRAEKNENKSFPLLLSTETDLPITTPENNDYLNLESKELETNSFLTNKLHETKKKLNLKKHDSKKRRQRYTKKLQREIRNLKEEVLRLNRDKNRYKKKYYRLANCSSKKYDSNENQVEENNEVSPKTKIERLLSGTNISKEIKNELIAGEVMKDNIKKHLSDENVDKGSKKAIQKILSTSTFKKYRIHNKIQNILPYKKNKAFLNKTKTLKKRKKMDTQMIKKIKDFFLEDTTSRQCPGKKDFLTRNKIKKQKRLLLYSLKSCYETFIKKYPNEKISFSSFYKCKPFWVVQAKVTDRETCACKEHENFKFILDKSFSSGIINTKDLNKITENKIELKTAEDDEATILKIKQWQSQTVKRDIKGVTKNIRITSAVTTEINKKNLKDLLLRMLPEFTDHHKLMLHQFEYLKYAKTNRNPDEIIFQIDFSQNYVTKMNTEIQSMHFGANKKQVSLHTGVCYITLNNEHNKTWSFATVSDNIDHQAHAIWCHLKPILRKIKFLHGNEINKFIFFSDGPTSQYKNRYNIYLAAKTMNNYFPNAVVCWNFSAPGHGKGPMDGVGGSIKRQADQKVAQKFDILCAKDIVNTIETKTFLVEISSKDIEEAKASIPSVPVIKNIGLAYQICWSVVDNVMMFNLRSKSCKECSFSEKCSHFSLTTGQITLGSEAETELSGSLVTTTTATQEIEDEVINTEDIIPNLGTWVAVVYGDKWFPGLVTHLDSKILTVKYLERRGKNFIWPARDDVQKIHYQEILCTIKEPKSVSKTRSDLFYLTDEEKINNLFETEIIS